MKQLLTSRVARLSVGVLAAAGILGGALYGCDREPLHRVHAPRTPSNCHAATDNDLGLACSTFITPRDGIWTLDASDPRDERRHCCLKP